MCAHRAANIKIQHIWQVGSELLTQTCCKQIYQYVLRLELKPSWRSADWPEEQGQRSDAMLERYQML